MKTLQIGNWWLVKRGPKVGMLYDGADGSVSGELSKYGLSLRRLDAFDRPVDKTIPFDVLKEALRLFEES